VAYLARADSARNAGNGLLAGDCYKTANSFFENALNIAIELDSLRSQATVYNNLSQLNLRQEKFLIALKFAQSAIEVQAKRRDTSGLAETYHRLGNIYLELGDLPRAIEAGTTGLEFANISNAGSSIRDNSELLYKANKAMNKTTDALDNYRRFINTRDSIREEENLNEELKNQYKLTYEKQAAEDSVKHAHEELMKDIEISKQQTQLRTSRVVRYGVYGFLAVVLGSTVFLFRGFQRKKRDNHIISLQKEEVEAHRRKILASINYAERIQKSILPDDSVIESYLPGFSKLYLPRDIVSGDFYWFAHRDGSSFLALADCTGHGVPGAFMSMIGSTLLKDIVVDSQISEPEKVLEMLDSEIRELLQQKNQGATEDGMDIALIRIDHAMKRLIFCGANQHIYIVREGEVESIGGTPRSIGGLTKAGTNTPYTRTELSLNEISAVYLSSGGMEDQLGGKSSTKFGSDGFVQVLKENGGKVEAPAFSQILSDWKGQQIQTDDICILGIQIMKTT
jgi:serine phosphatase RsbU (regulator of sigma subunit)